jgi:oxygen-independent coproporphyrinogen-3 oxidase
MGRSHTAQQTYEAMGLARTAGFGSINMDLIAGLPGDTPAGFEKTLDGVIALKPEEVTVHTLAMKRSSRLVTGGSAVYNARGEAANAMLELAAARLGSAGLAPYYLYRQRNTTGNLENVGYAIEGHEGLYNIFIMDETHTILSVGAGGVTKLKAPFTGHIERIFNFKYPDEYITRFDEILTRKKQVEKFYDDNDWKNKDITDNRQ